LTKNEQEYQNEMVICNVEFTLERHAGCMCL